MAKNKIQNRFVLINIAVLVSEFLVNSFATIYILQKGVDYTQIGVIFMLFLLGQTLLEYPSGGLADKFGRRKIYAIGIFLTSISYGFILSKHSFFLLCLSYFLKGIGAAFISGSLEAWLSCALKNNSEFNRIISIERLIEGISSFILPLVFLVVKIKNLDYVFMACLGIYLFLTIFVLSSLEENYGNRDNSIIEISKKGFVHLINNRQVMFIAGINIIAYLFFTIFLFVWQPLANMCKLGTDYFPTIYGVYLISSGVAAFYGRKWIDKNLNSNITRIAFTYIVSFILMLFAFNMENMGVLMVGMSVFGMGKGVVFMLVVSYINSNSANDLKASIFSLVNVLATIVNLIMQIVFGNIIDRFGLNIVLIIGLVLAFIWIVLTILLRISKNNIV